MSLPPITIPQLDPAGPIDPQNDLMLVRQGFNDRRITLGQILTIRLASLTYLPSPVNQNDVILVGRPNSGEYTNYLLRPQNLGFLSGTKMWFWQSHAPLGWTIIPDQGDRVLATGVQGGAYFQYRSEQRGNFSGTWQQSDHTLTTAQMPSHGHGIPIKKPWKKDTLIMVSGTDRTGGVDVAATSLTGGGQPHNHGSTWRPSASVGILCQKDVNYPVG